MFSRSYGGVLLAALTSVGYAQIAVAQRPASPQGKSLEELKDLCGDEHANHDRVAQACHAVIASHEADNDEKKDAWLSLAEVAANENRLTDAVDAASQAIRIAPHECLPLIGRGEVETMQNRLDAAIQDFTEANKYTTDGLCEEGPDNPIVRRGDVYFLQGDYAKAVVDYSEAARHKHMASKDLPIFTYLANRHLGREDNDELKAKLSDLASHQATAKFVHWSSFDEELEKTLLGQVDRDGLLKVAQSNDAEANGGQFSLAYFVLGEMESFRGNISQARDDYQASERFAPKGVGFYAARQLARLPAARTSGVGSVVSRPVPPKGQYYALVIGISAYPGSLRLQTPAADATAVGDLLANSYGFQVSRLLDQAANRTGILSAINSYRARLQPEDNLLIYFAGHGEWDREGGKAYWLPADADSSESSNAIIADEITAGVRRQKANHVLVIADSCYSGDLTREPTRAVPPIQTTAYLEEMRSRRSRTLISSGGDEPVLDGGGNGHSVFAAALIRALKEGDGESFTASHLFFDRVQQEVGGNSHQIPQYLYLPASGHDGGDFVFIRQTK